MRSLILSKISLSYNRSTVTAIDLPKMKYIQYNKHGGDYDSTIELVENETAPSDPPAGFALVKIHTAAGNPIDFKVAKGDLNGAWECPLPMTMGYDFSGTIVSVGGESEFKSGDEVFAVTWGKVCVVCILLSYEFRHTEDN